MACKTIQKLDCELRGKPEHENPREQEHMGLSAISFQSALIGPSADKERNPTVIPTPIPELP